jgi:hypothetical protein
MTAARLGKLSPPVRETENQKIADTETAGQGRRLQVLMRRHPQAVTVRDALAAERCTLDEWLLGQVGA